MKFKKFIAVMSFSFLLMSGASFFGGCTPMITEEQKAKLNELRKQEAELSEKINVAKKDKAAIEAELNSRKTEYNKCNETREFIKDKLANWPKWPDWKPEEPKQEEQK